RGRCGQRRLADADAHAQNEQLPVVLRRRTKRCEEAPERRAAHHHVATAGAIGETRDWEAEHREEQRERDAGEVAELGVGDLKIALERTNEQAEYLLIDVSADAEQHENGDYVPRIPAAASRLTLARVVHDKKIVAADSKPSRRSGRGAVSGFASVCR